MSKLKIICILFLLTVTIPTESKFSIKKIKDKISSLFSSTKNGTMMQKEFKDVKRLELFSDQGDIFIHSWKQSSVMVESQQEGTEQQIRYTPIIYSLKNGCLQIDIGCKDKKNCATTKMNIIVPENLELKIGAKNGDVTIKNISGKIYIETESGDISVTDGTNDLTAITTAGSISVQQEKMERNGILKLKTNDGSIKLTVPQDISSALSAESKYGKINSELFVKIDSKIMKLNDNNFKKLKHEISGIITESKDQKINGNIELSTEFGPIIIKAYS